MHQRRRIILLFGLGIVLPSLLLGYLAFRGIQNDRALVEKERLEGTRRAADQVVRAVDGEITAVETALAKVVSDRPGLPSPEMKTALDQWEAGTPLVEEIFVLQGGDGIQFPLARPLYAPDGRRDAGLSAAAEPDRSAEFQAAERLEFQNRNYPAALAAYRRALDSTSDPRLAGLILNAVARVQKKSGLFKEAISTYENIGRDHGQIIIPGGMPLGPSAALEICSMSWELGDAAGSLRTCLELYRSLLRHEWSLEKAEFEFFVGRARSMIEATFSSPPPGLELSTATTEFQSLRGEEAEARQRTERMIVFEENAASALEAKMRAAGGRDASGPPFIRLALETGGYSFLVSVGKPAEGAGATPQTVWGFILDAERLLENVLRPALLVQFPSAETPWVVVGKDGTAVLRSSEVPAAGPVTLRADFAPNVPDWTLEFRQPPPRLIKTFLLSRRGLYFFVFLLIAGILVFGLALTLRSVSHELELARMKSDFVSTVSHEFKSPLTSIRQLAEMLQSGRVPSEERRQKYYNVLLEQSERLALLTDNILGLARIEEGRAEFAFEATDIAALLAGVVAAIQERVRHEGFEIEFEVEGTIPLLAVDRTTLSQAVTNLLDNAIKYSGESRKVSARVFIDGPHLAIAVRDFGIGIRKEDIPRLFERFYRAGDELTRTVKGSGLGLTLVKEIVEAHGGAVRVESEPGKGSVFEIRLPLPRQEGG